mmetsp:Transcript_46543/g.61675  ORF Transcript_46543/g.61675 Transcript_46543/m.61675 type:complete len:83 (-) Transcript_46543:767-1015(-)|eukprot:CAMPEP_0185599692 /NCGR_PEP_ID=MMETSP0434-20130131/82875_1 /TAXON_ID=626734 ORGANISM="Favella taraikaensis, Strain Fe Narragansett Bay" /NCGR_SAMPLE_ID=MMETSP0434 /ASSEMBLY_ACC=CAM_ASM_000379 /LENGTH=82 /DNA_ID=CAMNT_0028229179 /DNA_START=548 /DNA_END=796 /DNA_ORIENTATION=-
MLGKILIKECIEAYRDGNQGEIATTKKQLKKFLEKFNRYDADKLCKYLEDKSDSSNDMKDEQILLLFRQNNFKDAFSKQFDS